MGEVSGIFVDTIDIDPVDASPQAPGLQREFMLSPGDEVTAQELEQFLEEYQKEIKRRASMDPSIQSPTDAISFFGSGYKITYDMRVKAPVSAAAKAKARAYIRFKNPFEFDMIRFKLVEPMKNSSVRNEYRVMATVEKA